MKRMAIVAAVLALAATGAQAIDCGTGGIIYWARVPSQTTNTYANLYRVTINPDWTVAVSASTYFDCVPWSSNYNTYASYETNNIVSLYDPRATGGQGTLLVPTPETGGTYTAPWSLTQEKPSTLAQTVIYPGASTNWDSGEMGMVIPTPNGWRGLSTTPSTNFPGGLSLAGFGNYTVQHIYALHDANGSGQIEDSASEAFAMSGAGSTVRAQMGLDCCLYFANTSYGNGPHIFKMTNSGTLTTFFNAGGAGNPVVSNTDGQGMAVASGTSFPIVYTFGMDASNNLGIFALRDGITGTHDGQVIPGDANDCITEVWSYGQQGLSPGEGNNGFSGEGLVYLKTPDTGKQFLLFDTYSSADGLFVLELADNGLVSTAGAHITAASMGNCPYGPESGFTIDWNFVSVPEPATMTLLGTGALGVLGWIRRRVSR